MRRTSNMSALFRKSVLRHLTSQCVPAGRRIMVPRLSKIP